MQDLVTTHERLKKKSAESYQPGIKVSDEELERINIHRDKFHGDWNYEIRPRSASQIG